MDDIGADRRAISQVDCPELATADDSAVVTIDPLDDVSTIDSLITTDDNIDSSRASVDKRHRQLKPPVGIVAASFFGLFAAVGYTAANVALRYSIGLDPFLVSAVKAAPTVLFLAPVLIWMWLTSRTIATSTKMIPRFAATALLTQIVGNAAFQVALGVIGLAASVPITLGVLIIGGAFLGRVMLGEPVRLRTILAMLTLIAAVVVLSLPGATEKPISSTNSLPIWAGAMMAVASGAAYALFGVMLRQTLTGGLSPPATMFISGVVGTISLWSIALSRLGTSGLSAVSLDQWSVMATAGLCNFMAFVALSIALKALPVVAVNLLNATQVAMAAVAGVVLFAEPVTWPLVTGIALTLAGLVILANRKKKTNSESPKVAISLREM